MLTFGSIVNDKIKVMNPIAKGGYAVLYGAKRLTDGASVVLKVLRDDVTGEDPTAADRFVREAGAAMLLEHPNVIRTLDVGQLESGTPWILLERLHGTTLAKLILDKPQEPELVADLLRQMLRGLAHAHEQQMIHRDIKPSNVFVCDPERQDVEDDERVKLLDFGFVKVFGSEDPDLNKPLTLVGQAVGTPGYMAPELFSGGELGPQLDLYSTGILGYELLTGSLAYPGEGMQRAVKQVREEPQEPPQEITSTPLWPVVTRLFERDTNQRFATADEALAALKDLYVAEPRKRGLSRWLGFFKRRR